MQRTSETDTRILFNKHTGGLDLRQLRHSAATHLGDQKVPLQLIMSKTRHFDALHLAACGLAGDDRTGPILLLGPGAGIEINDGDPADVTIHEGRHRITAMRDAGVRRTIIQRSEVTPA